MGKSVPVFMILKWEINFLRVGETYGRAARTDSSHNSASKSEMV